MCLWHVSELQSILATSTSYCIIAFIIIIASLGTSTEITKMHPQATKRIIVYKSLALVNLVDPINHINVFVKPRKKKSLLVQRHLPLFVTQAEQACHQETAFQTSEHLS